MMADPTIQTFCCHHSRNGTDMAVMVMDEFNTHSYNALCLTSSIIGIMGALYQILPREEHVRPNVSTRGRQIIIWLAVADLLASLGVMVRSALWMNYKSMIPIEDDTSNVLFCAITSAWTQYFYTATWIWTLCYAIDTHLLLRNRDSHTSVYHSVSWGLPAVLTATGLSILYYPNANCHNLRSLKGALVRVLPNYCATYIPITVVMVANPIIYFFSSKDMEVAVFGAYSQITSKERSLVHDLKLKFTLINISFYLCWLPNLVNGILLWTLWFNLPIKVIIVVWYIMALMNPLQALLNAIIYRRWTPGMQKLKLPFNMNCFSTFKSREEQPNAETPLLGHRPPSRLRLTDHPRNSINALSSM